MAQPNIDSFFVSRKRRRFDDAGGGIKKRPCLMGSDADSAVNNAAVVEKSDHKKQISRTKTTRSSNSSARASTGQKRLSELLGWQKDSSRSEEAQQSAGIESTDVGDSGYEKPLLYSGVRRSGNVQRKLFTDDDDSGVSAAVTDTATSQQVATSPAVKAMSPLKMKVSLSGCSKIQQLRERLAQFNQASDRLKSFQRRQKSPHLSTPSRNHEASLEFEITSPQKTPKKILLSPSPVKSPSVGRCLQLIDSAPSSLTLPFKYRQLKEVFHCVDTCMSFMHNRKEVITMRKLRSSVQQMLGRSFGEHQLAQLCTVFPRAYHVRRERDLPHLSTTPNSKNKWHLVIEINLDYDQAVVGADRNNTQLTPQRLLQRAQIFSAALLDMVRQHHEEFLGSLDPPVPPPSVERLNRWHPEFPIEEVPDVCGACLPSIPADQRPATASDLLSRASQLLAPYPALTSCLEQVASAGTTCQQQTAAEDTSTPNTVPDVPETTATAGLPAGLLARIRAREAARANQVMTRSADDERRREMLARLPVLVRSVRSIFVTERRSALPQQTLVSRLASASDGFKQMPAAFLLEHLQLLAKEAPLFVSLTSLKSGEFVKLDKNCNINSVISKLEELHQKL